jgi:hypothetical protein
MTIVNAAEHRNLQTVIIVDKEDDIRPVTISLKTGDSMSNVQLRRLLDDISRSESKEDKVRLIRSHFFSLHDYLDLLESDCLYGEDYEALYASFSDTELAILCKIMFYEELRGGAADLYTIIQGREGAERDWQNHLIGFMKRLDLRVSGRLMNGSAALRMKRSAFIDCTSLGVLRRARRAMHE